MAWTAPRTWTDGEFENAAIFNPHIRDNFLAMGEHLIARKTSNQTVTSSTTLVNDTALVLPVGANEVWQFGFNLIYTAATTGDIKFAFTFPAAGEIAAAAAFWDANAVVDYFTWVGTTTPTTARSVAGNGGTQKLFL